MGVAYNPCISNNGLVLCLDAANPKSYPGSGTTWTDLSGNGNNGTLVGTPTFSSGAFTFNGTSQYVSFGGAPASLKLTNFSLSCWFQWSNGGSTSTTGSGGVVYYPLITKGRGEADGSNVDMNYGFGITTGSVIAADFENLATGQNYPITSGTTITKDIWYNACITYNGVSWNVYINGSLTDSSTVNQTPRNDSIQYNAIATAMNSTGVVEGYFSGKIAVSYIHNRALSSEEVSENFNALRGRFGI